MTRTQFRVLYRQFVFRMVDLELLSAQGSMSKLLGQFAALLISVSMALGLIAFGGGDPRMRLQTRLIVSWSVAHFLIATTMLVVGLFAVLCWDSTFPDQRDVMVLAPLPVRPRTLFLAKVTAVSTALIMTVGALHLLAGITWPFSLARQRTAVMAPSVGYDAALPPADVADLEKILDRDLAPALQSGTVAPATGAGLAIGILKHGVRRILTYGTAQPDSIYEIGSISKTFTGLLLAKMAEEGSVELSQPVRELLPAGMVEKPRAREITLLDLATHHSGLPSMASNIRPNGQPNSDADYHPADLYEYIAQRGVAKPSETSFVYSNIGYSLLGQALAERAGIPYPELLKREITDPLGMKDTVVLLSSEQRSRVIQAWDLQHRPVGAWDLDALAPAGGIRSTAGDLLTWLDANLHPERLDQLGAALVLSHQPRADVQARSRIALAWIYDADSATYWHDGSISAYMSYAFFHPRGDYAAVILLNTGSKVIPFADLLGRHLRQRFGGEPAISLASVPVPAGGGFMGVIRSFAAYWITMYAAGAFIFCCVLGLQGLAAQLPRRYFLRVSSFLQMAAFGVLVCVYLLQPLMIAPTLVSATQLAWLPSYWFLGIFEQLNGSPAMASLARRAWIALAVALAVTAASYALSYFRTMRKIVEEPDILSRSRGASWLPRFGNSLETAVVQFSIRTLARSRQHRVMMAFYLGLGLALAVFIMSSPNFQKLVAQGEVSLLYSSLAIMTAWVVGARLAFSLPLDLRANWIFRVTEIRGVRDYLAAIRRPIFILGVLPAWLVAAATFLYLWAWQAAVMHLVVLGLWGIMLAYLGLNGFQKIPFTCSYLPGKSYVHMVFLGVLGFFLLLGRGADLERRALEDPASYVATVAVLGIATALARWRALAQAHDDEAIVQFEELPEPAILTLKLDASKS
jgi:CubicO group peptidase (beta-lactamase class C family)